MPLVTSHFKERFVERNPEGNFKHFYALMKQNELVLIKSIPVSKGRMDEYFQYICPITNKEFVALRRSGEVCGIVWVTFMNMELFVSRQYEIVDSFNNRPSFSHNRKKDYAKCNKKYNTKSSHVRKRTIKSRYS